MLRNNSWNTSIVLFYTNNWHKIGPNVSGLEKGKSRRNVAGKLHSEYKWQYPEVPGGWRRKLYREVWTSETVNATSY